MEGRPPPTALADRCRRNAANSMMKATRPPSAGRGGARPAAPSAARPAAAKPAAKPAAATRPAAGAGAAGAGRAGVKLPPIWVRYVSYAQPSPSKLRQRWRLALSPSTCHDQQCRVVAVVVLWWRHGRRWCPSSPSVADVEVQWCSGRSAKARLTTAVSHQRCQSWLRS